MGKIKRYNKNGEMINEYSTVTEAARKIKEELKIKDKIKTIISEINQGIRYLDSIHFNSYWRKETGIIKPPMIKKQCSYYLCDNRGYRQCGRKFVSEGKNNRYCYKCRRIIERLAENSINREVKHNLANLKFKTEE